MINYQECRDTTGNTEQPEKIIVIYKKRIVPTIIIIILIVLLLVIIILWQRRLIRRAFNYRSTKWLVGGVSILLILIGLLILLLVLRKRKLKRDQENKKPDWLGPFVAAPVPILPALVTFIKRKPKFFDLDRSKLVTKEYQVFNPNGYMKGDEMVIAMRCSNGKTSYPMITYYNQNGKNMKINRSYRMDIESRQNMRSKEMLGFEDMRLFRFNDRIYMIGVNLDRSPKNLPCMILAEVDLRENRSLNVWHLNYEPLSNVPNKNWAPLKLPDGELGFIVDIDPLLIVKRRQKGFSQDCEVAYKIDKKQTNIDKLRNSSIVIDWKDVPDDFKIVLQRGLIKNKILEFGDCRYFLMGHTKFVECEYERDGWRVIYQHYFVIIDLYKDGTSKVHLSKPFYVEENDRPHIEYISGVCFQRTNKGNMMWIMYGMKDKESKYLKLSAADLYGYLNN